jgi:hypothetical protein
MVGDGSIALVQLANVFSTIELLNMFGPTTYTWTSSGEFTLDAPTNGIPQYQGIQQIYQDDASSTLTPDRFDSPNTAVTNSMILATRSDYFTDYLMFKSDRDGSIWVTLRKMQWNWSGSASNTTSGGVVYATSNSKSNSTVSTDLPQWSNFTGNLQFH